MKPIQSLFALFLLLCFASCAFSIDKKELEGCWISQAVEGTSYTHNLLYLNQKATGNADGVFFKAYASDKKVVKDSVTSGKWKMEAVYSSTYFGNINKLILTPDDTAKVPVSFEFYYDGSVLNLLDRTTQKPSHQSYMKTDAFKESDFKR